MFQTFIITIFIISGCVLIMSLGYLISGKKNERGSCGNSDGKPCDCTIKEKLNAQLLITNP